MFDPPLTHDSTMLSIYKVESSRLLDDEQVMLIHKILLFFKQLKTEP